MDNAIYVKDAQIVYDRMIDVLNSCDQNHALVFQDYYQLNTNLDLSKIFEKIIAKNFLWEKKQIGVEPFSDKVQPFLVGRALTKPSKVKSPS